jgi:hypothetical protein
MESDITVVADNFGAILIIFSMRLVSDQTMIGSESSTGAISNARLTSIRDVAQTSQMRK